MLLNIFTKVINTNITFKRLGIPLTFFNPKTSSSSSHSSSINC